MSRATDINQFLVYTPSKCQNGISYGITILTQLGMWRILNPHPNPTESDSLSEIWNPTDT